MPHYQSVENGADQARKRSLSGSISGPATPPVIELGSQHYRSDESILLDCDTSGGSSTGGGKPQKGTGSHKYGVSSPSEPPKSMPSRFKHFFMDNFTRPRSKSDAMSHQPTTGSACRNPQRLSTGGHVTPILPLTVCTNFPSGRVDRDWESPLGSPGLMPIPQGQTLTTPPTTPRSGVGRMIGGGSGSNDYCSPQAFFHEHSTTAASPSPDSNSSGSHKFKRRSKSPRGTGPSVGNGSGGFIDRLRGLSSSYGSSNGGSGGAMPDPAKMPREEPRSSLSFTQAHLKMQRVRKLTFPLPNSPDPQDLTKSIIHLSKSEETLIASIAAGHLRDDLERALSPVTDPTEQTAVTAITFGVRRVSENRRFLMLSKSPLRTPSEYLEGGVELLGDNDAYSLFFQHSTCYDLMPDSAKLVVLDSQLTVGRAFRALVFNCVRSAPIWSSGLQRFVGMLTITDFIRVLNLHCRSPAEHPIEELESQTIEEWREMFSMPKHLRHVIPEDSLYTALSELARLHVHRLPMVDHRSGNALHIITHKRLLQYLHLRSSQMPQPTFLQSTLEESELNCLKEVYTVEPDCPITDVLRLFEEKQVSALPVVEPRTKRLLDIYAKFDCIQLAATGAYKNLNFTVAQALDRRSKFPVETCLKTDKLSQVAEKIVSKGVHRLVVINSPIDLQVIGIVSLSDLLRVMVLRQGEHLHVGTCARRHNTMPPAIHSLQTPISCRDRRHSSPLCTGTGGASAGGSISPPPPFPQRTSAAMRNHPVEMDEELFKMDVDI